MLWQFCFFAKFFQQRRIRLQESLLPTAVKPTFDFKGLKFYAHMEHAVQCVGQAVLAVCPQALQVIIFETLKKLIAFFDLIDTNQRHIRFWNLRLFDDMMNESFLVYFSHTKLTGIIYFSYTQHGARAVYDIQHVIFTNCISQHHHYFIIFHYFFGHLNRMPHALPVDLLNVMSLQIRIFCLHIIPDLIP